MDSVSPGGNVKTRSAMSGSHYAFRREQIVGSYILLLVVFYPSSSSAVESISGGLGARLGSYGLCRSPRTHLSSKLQQGSCA